MLHSNERPAPSINEQGLIAITEQGDRQVVNARDLHAFLEVKSDFNNWIKNRIRDYNFSENQDFEVFVNNYENSKGGRPTKEYAITLDMAKELSMLERNQKGKDARKYFIEVEKRWRKVQSSQKIMLQISPNVVFSVYPHPLHEFLISTKNLSEALQVAENTLLVHKSRAKFQENKHFIFNVKLDEGLPHNAVLFTKFGVAEFAYHLRSGYAKDLRDWVENLKMNAPKSLPDKRRHNRLTPSRMVEILADVAKIEDSALRLSLISKLGV